MTNATARRPDIDNLRSAATFLLLAFHTAKVYDYSEFYHLKNRATFVGFDVFTGFVHQWHMPLFFALAGWSMAAALKKRGAAEIRKERVNRLLIPLIAWTLITCPFIRWIELDHIDHVHESFLAFLPTFFGLRFSWSHLWFLAYLLTFSLVYLPLFVRLNARTTDPVVTRSTLVKFLGGMVAIQVLLRDLARLSESLLGLGELQLLQRLLRRWFLRRSFPVGRQAGRRPPRCDDAHRFGCRSVPNPVLLAPRDDRGRE